VGSSTTPAPTRHGQIDRSGECRQGRRTAEARVATSGSGATTTVSATPDEVFDFVLDLHHYRQADHKVGRVGTIHNDGDRGTAQFSGRIRGLPAPSGTYPFTRTDSRLTFGSPIAGPARWFINFEGTFDTERTPDGTVVTHREALSFKRPCQWLAGNAASELAREGHDRGDGPLQAARRASRRRAYFRAVDTIPERRRGWGGMPGYP
jgi:hypothetical protein